MFSGFQSKLLVPLLKTQQRPFSGKVGLYAGSFDPPSLGHLDIITRASSLCEKLYIGVAVNPNKKKPVFPTEKRLELIHKMTDDIDINIRPVQIEGLLVDFASQNEVDFFVRGLRSHSDLDSEMVMAFMNRKMSSLETVMLVASAGRVHISSSIIRDLAKHNKRLKGFVPSQIEDEVYEHLFRFYKNGKQ